MAPTRATSGSFSARSSGTETRQGGSGTVGDANVEPYDLLAFLSQFLSVFGHAPPTPAQGYLATVFLDERVYQLPCERSSGGTSRVVVVNSEAVTKRGFYWLGESIVGKTIALKTAKPSAVQGGVAVDRTLLRSMSTELRILSEQSIHSHGNIITLLGICWQRAGENHDLVLPVFVYETTELGDLKAWLPENRDVTLGIQLDLCLGIARGVACLHEAGVAHCDIKPENILVFRQDDPECPFIPKIIDFNIAVLFQDVPDDDAPLLAGTSPWNSPEQMTRRSINKGDMPKVDVYSLGLLILNILTIDYSKRILDVMAEEPVGGVSLLDLKQSGSLAMNAAKFLGFFGLVCGPKGDNRRFEQDAQSWLRENRFRGCWMRASLLVCGALDGDLRHRTSSASQMIDGLESIYAHAKGHDLLGYTNPDLYSEATSVEDRFRLTIYPGSAELRRLQIQRIKTVWKSLCLMSEDEIAAEPVTETGPWQPQARINQRKGDEEVIEIYGNSGTFTLLPPAVRWHIMQQLDVVYSCTQQPLPRRCRAAFEHAVASLSFDITQDPGDENDAMITRALTMLGFAATNGHETARRMFGWLQATLRPGAALATAIEDGQELEWLASGMTAGSRICARRLRQLNPGRHRATLRVLRRDYGGIGSKCWHLPPLGPDFSKAEAYQLWYHSTTGHETELRRTCAVSREAVNATFEGEASLPAACRENVNATFKGETPLIAACRSGHGKIARSLLEAGASAAQLDDCGRGPLHYLSSLDAEDMQDIAARLMAAGASLEAWSWYTTDLWCGGFDSLYGHANGTPLFWAVQADCRPAVEVLLGLGAQVFPQSAGRPTSIDKERHYSPVHWAARMHQSEILGLLLGHAEANSSTTGGKGVAEALNTAWEACQERLTRVLPVNLAATYGGGDVFSRILLHGASHIEQCFKTVHLLLDAGTSIERLGEADHRLALKMAAELGPPYALRALRTWRDGAFRPDMDEWGTAVCMACAHDDRSTFDELRAMDVAVPKGPLGWPSMLAQVALVTNQTYYVHAIMEMHEALDPAPADYSAAFDAAWSRGHDRVAAAILERAGRCDVDTLTPLPRKEYVYVMADEQEGSPPAPANSSGGALSAIWSRGHEKIPADVLESITRSIGHSNVKTLTAVSPVQEYRSILGSLISEATSHPGHVKTIDLFLRMVGARDSVFHAVFKREGDPSPTVYNALEYALSYRPHLNCESPVVQILEVLTKYFQHPHKHLNAPSVAGNQSLLHLAVQTGDWRAACFLLQLGGVDLRARNADGWVAFDWCLLRWEDSSRDESPVHSGVLARVSKEKAQEHWETDTRELMRVMKGGGASKFGSISLVVKRLSAEELLIIGIDEEGEYGICTALEQDVLSQIPALQPSPLQQIVKDLGVGRNLRLLHRGSREDAQRIKGYEFH